MPTKITDLSPTKRKEELIFSEVQHHEEIGFQETERRSTGKGRVGSISFNEADELFRSYLDENNWPYDALLFDPRIFTFIFEKTSRLIANKPKGRLIPREGADVLSAKINNSLLDYQWDQANFGGTMLQKWALMDINTRKYGAAFALCAWKYETDRGGRIVFDGPEMEVLNNRDVAHDLTATAIENANWIQVRKYVTLQSLERVNDAARGAPIYKNLEELRFSLNQQDKTKETGGLQGQGEGRETHWISRNRQISKLETDPYGKDQVFRTVEIVTEYRRDRWITFAPRQGIILRDIPNPYMNNEIPIVMLKYYMIDDDLYGMSEIEPVKGIQKAINAILCQYIDEINQNLYSPIAIGPGVKQHTLEWGKGARWIMNNPMTDFRLVESRSNAAQFFNNTYSVLVSAMMNALGESSLGVSNIQPYQQDKTATEVKALQLQRNARDNYNQLMLSESIKRQFMLWHSMNQNLLFSDPTRENFVIRIVGRDAIKYFQERGLGDMGIGDEATKYMQQMADTFGVGLDELRSKYGIKGEQFAFPKYPVNLKSDGDTEVKPKLLVDEGKNSASLAVEEKDIKGLFDFSVDVESMAVSSDDERKQARQTAVSLLVSNPNITAYLQQEGVKPKFKELFIAWLEDLGFSDADKFFENLQGAQGGMSGQGNGGNSPEDQMADMVKMFQGGGQQGGNPTQQLQQVTQQMNPGTGANQLVKVVPQGTGQQQEGQALGNPNPSEYQQLVNKFSGGAQQNGGQQ